MFSWNSLEQLIGYQRFDSASPVTITYEYDHAGNRLATTKNGVRVEHIYDIVSENPTLIATRDSTLQQLNYVHAGESLWQADGSEVYQYHLDLVDSVLGLSNEAGETVNRYAYDYFGQIEDSVESVVSPFTFAGGIQDDAAGPIQMRARYYDAASGRFISIDPHDGDISDPFSLNRYLYARNKPTTLSDPTGRQTSFAEVATVTGIIGGLAALATGSIGYYMNQYFNTVDWTGTSVAGTFDPKATLSKAFPKFSGKSVNIGTSVGLQLNIMNTQNGPQRDGSDYNETINATSGTIIAGLSAGPSRSWPVALVVGGFEVSVIRGLTPDGIPSLVLSGPYLLIGGTATVLGMGSTVGSTLVMGFGVGNADGNSIDVIGYASAAFTPTFGTQVSITGGVTIPFYDSNFAEEIGEFLNGGIA